MFRAELGNGDRDRAVAVLERLKQRYVPRPSPETRSVLIPPFFQTLS